MSDLSPECAPKRTSADHSEFRAALHHPPARHHDLDRRRLAAAVLRDDGTVIGETIRPALWPPICLTSEFECRETLTDPLEPMAMNGKMRL
jgi:hypothetical protein